MTNIEVLQDAIQGIKFTPAQKNIINMLQKGYTIKVVNKHHISGGQMKWYRDGETMHAGKVYKAFFNTFHKIKRAKGKSIQNLFIF